MARKRASRASGAALRAAGVQRGKIVKATLPVLPEIIQPAIQMIVEKGGMQSHKVRQRQGERAMLSDEERQRRGRNAVGRGREESSDGP